MNLFYYEDLQLIVIFWFLLLMRMVSGITGKGLTTFDIFSLLGFTAMFDNDFAWNKSLYGITSQPIPCVYLLIGYSNGVYGGLGLYGL